MKIGVIIEARMSSTRLPGKVLMKVNNKTMLQLIVDRVNLIKKIDTTIVATTINKKDDEIIDWCKLKKIKFFRGSEDNVLNRVYKAAKKFRLSTIILITGDCPLIDHNIISQVLNIYLNNNADYVSNSHIRTYPDGKAMFRFQVCIGDEVIEIELLKRNLSKSEIKDLRLATAGQAVDFIVDKKINENLLRVSNLIVV